MGTPIEGGILPMSDGLHPSLLYIALAGLTDILIAGEKYLILLVALLHALELRVGLYKK